MIERGWISCHSPAALEAENVYNLIGPIRNIEGILLN